MNLAFGVMRKKKPSPDIYYIRTALDLQTVTAIMGYMFCFSFSYFSVTPLFATNAAFSKKREKRGWGLINRSHSPNQEKVRMQDTGKNGPQFQCLRCDSL